jgi:hypothetical protein
VSRAPDRFHPTGVFRTGQMVRRAACAWSTTVHALLRHLAAVGFTAAPQVIEPGFDDQGREMLTFIEGEVRPTGPWSLEAAFEIGRLSAAQRRPAMCLCLHSLTQVVEHDVLAPMLVG